MTTTRNSVKLDKSFAGHPAKKFRCPSCGQKRFVRYYDFEAREYLPEKYGRCDREQHCGYFEHPFDDLKQAKDAEEFAHLGIKTWTAPPPAVIKAVDKEIVKRTLDKYEQNTFVNYLASLIGWEPAQKLAIASFIGTARDGSCIFWFVDDRFRVRTGSKILYDSVTGKRVKGQKFDASRLFKIDDGYTPCLFGVHQLFNAPEGAIVGIVESEKTAILCSIYLQLIGGRQVMWLASSGVNGLTTEKCKCLEGWEVMLCPDFSFHARATWGMVPMRKKRNERGNLLPYPDGDLVEEYESAADRLRKIGAQVFFYDPAPEVMDGSDIADLLIIQPVPVRYDQPDFQSLDLAGSITGVVEAGTGPKFNDLPQSVTLPLSGEFPFKIKHYQSGRYEILSETPQVITSVERMLQNHPNVGFLVEKFEICTGSIKPML